MRAIRRDSYLVRVHLRGIELNQKKTKDSDRFRLVYSAVYLAREKICLYS